MNETASVADDPGAALVRRFYDARSRNDRAAIREILAPDVAWHDPYPPPHGGDLRGIEAVLRDVFDRAGALTGGTTRLSLRGVVASASHVAAVVDWSATLGGRSATGSELAVFRVERGRIAEAWFHPDAKEESDRFFGGA